jgi:hypothetical protein
MANLKVTGRRLCDFHGLKISGKVTKAKRTGKDRIWIQIRQDSPKKFRVGSSLSYARAVDIEFVDDPE